MSTTSLFSTLWTVLRKELRDISRDRRTLALALLLSPLLYPILILGIGALSESRVRTQIDKPLDIPTLGRSNAPNLVRFLAAQGLNAVDAPADLTAAIATRMWMWHCASATVMQRIGAKAAGMVEIIKDSTRREADVPSMRLQAALSGYSQQVGALRLLARGIDAQVSRPLEVAAQDLATAEAKRGQMMAMLLPVLLVITSFLGARR